MKEKSPKKSGVSERAKAQADDSLAGSDKRRGETNLEAGTPVDLIAEEARFLSPKQARFAREYIVDLNGAQAAIRAGYAPANANVQASALLRNPLLQAYVEKLQAGRAAALALKSEDVLASLLEIRERCMQAEEVTEWNFAKKCFEGTGEYRFDSTGANRATELIGKHLGMFTEKFSGTIKHDHTVLQQQAITLADLPPELLQQIQEALEKKEPLRIIEHQSDNEQAP